MRMYEIDIKVEIAVCAHNEDEAKEVALDQFRKGKYKDTGFIDYCKEATR